MVGQHQIGFKSGLDSLDTLMIQRLIQGAHPAIENRLHRLLSPGVLSGRDSVLKAKSEPSGQVWSAIRCVPCPIPLRPPPRGSPMAQLDRLPVYTL
jgi:hypothetical protein